MIRIYENPAEASRILKRWSMLTVDDVPAVVLQSIERVFGEALTPEEAVAKLLTEVRATGDEALRSWTQRIDGVIPEALEVPKTAWAAAYDETLSPDLRAVLERAAERIRDFHARQPVPSWSTDEMGGTLGQRLVPLERVGVYVPGGTAPLPSSLLMAAIPARVAGVDEIIVCTPADRETGMPSPLILAAAQVAAVDRVFALGGALAVAAMAFGTETVPKVDKVVGAGGLFTTIAKRQVYGIVGLDGLYGPTETVIVADDAANPVWVAADLLAQAEHDVLATAILITPSRSLATAVQAEVARQTETLSRARTVEVSLAGQGGIVLTPDLETAVRLADDFAPEHLCLSVGDPAAWVSKIRNAGGIFVGEHSFEVLGDYVAGPSHIMPTGGTARFKGPVNILDFVKVINLIGLDADTAQALAPDAARLAEAESLTAHAAAARLRAVSEKGTL
ncbi:MAG: histidinol dehydrogenase [Anaerolineae bacterium]